MKVIVCNPHHRPRIADLENDLSAFQETVGGYIETLPLDGNSVIVCDEEGKLKNKPYNRFYWYDGNIVDVICGSFFIVGVDGCEFCGLTNEQIDRYMNEFMIPDFTWGG